MNISQPAVIRRLVFCVRRRVYFFVVREGKQIFTIDRGTGFVYHQTSGVGSLR